MFKHGRTGKIYYSVREKIKHYSKIAYNDKTASPKQKAHALCRLSELKELDKRPFIEPTMVVTNDKHFSNSIDKPRACVIVGIDSKKRLIAHPVHDRTSDVVILDNDITRQVDGQYALIDRSDVFETKYIDELAELTEADKRKIKAIHSRNK